MNKIIIAVSAGLVVLFSLIWFIGSENAKTPPGYTGYIQQGSIFGKVKYIGLQTGPTSSGRNWLYNVTNISITPYTEDELWNNKDIILAKDKLPLNVDAHLVWRLKPDKIEDFMDHYGGVQGKDHPLDYVEKLAYQQFIRSPFRNMIRDEISKYEGLEISNNLSSISNDIQQQARERFKDTPFEIINAVIGNVSPPAAVTEQIAKKVAAKQELERKQTELEIAQKKEEISRAEGRALAAQEVEEAKGKSAAIAEIKKELTGSYLTYQAIQGLNGAQRVYIPLGNNGFPLVGNLNVDEPSLLLPHTEPPLPEK